MDGSEKHPLVWCPRKESGRFGQFLMLDIKHWPTPSRVFISFLPSLPLSFYPALLPQGWHAPRAFIAHNFCLGLCFLYNTGWVTIYDLFGRSGCLFFLRCLKVPHTPRTWWNSGEEDRLQLNRITGFIQIYIVLRHRNKSVVWKLLSLVHWSCHMAVKSMKAKYITQEILSSCPKNILLLLEQNIKVI